MYVRMVDRKRLVFWYIQQHDLLRMYSRLRFKDTPHFILSSVSINLTRGSVFKIPRPLLTHCPQGQRRRSICQKTRVRSRNATTKRCFLKPTTQQGDLKAATTAAVVYSNTCIPSFEFPSPTETREGVQHDLHRQCNVHGDAVVLFL